MKSSFFLTKGVMLSQMLRIRVEDEGSPRSPPNPAGAHTARVHFCPLNPVHWLGLGFSV